MATSRYVGIDVSKDRLDVAVLGEEQVWQVENSQTGIAELVARMQDLQPELIVVGATSGYQRAMVEALFWAGGGGSEPGAGQPICTFLWLAGQDRQAGCQVLAVFGQRVQPRHYAAKSEAGKQLSALLVRRKQVDEMLKAEQNHLRTVSPS
jgi:transposase